MRALGDGRMVEPHGRTWCSGGGGRVWATLGHPWNEILVSSVSHSGVHHAAGRGRSCVQIRTEGFRRYDEDDATGLGSPFIVLLGHSWARMMVIGSRSSSESVRLYADVPADHPSRPR
ncbi:hypothetical protein ACLKA6_013663 [Drosophila palustris]